MSKITINLINEDNGTTSYVVEDNADLGDKAYLWTSSWIKAKLYCLYLNLFA